MRGVILLTAAALLAGCSMQPGPVAPAAAIPASWPTGDAYLRQSEAGLPDQPWRTVFGDARLQALIAQALEANQDVQAAAARVALSRAQYRIQRAEQLPQLDAGASLSRNDAGGSARAEAGITGYEIDLFGRLDALSDAAKARYLASDSAARAVRLSLVADVADAWLAYGADSSLLAVARQTVEAAEQSRKLTEVRYKGGIAPRSDVRQAEIALHT
ncbi:MAG TPA: TolC family protein, partial [Chakrabartia sp.]|nr:TolC family protein [Chakrabartia sp.]